MIPILTIEYYPKCLWLSRAACMAREILTTFTDEAGAGTLKPGEINRHCITRIDDDKVFHRKE